MSRKRSRVVIPGLDHYQAAFEDGSVSWIQTDGWVSPVVKCRSRSEGAQDSQQAVLPGVAQWRI